MWRTGRGWCEVEGVVQRPWSLTKMEDMDWYGGCPDVQDMGWLCGGEDGQRMYVKCDLTSGEMGASISCRCADMQESGNKE